jgi:hypothetical protein
VIGVLERKIWVSEEVEGARKGGDGVVEGPIAGVWAIEAEKSAKGRKTVVGYGNVTRGEVGDEGERSRRIMGPE